MLDQPGLILFCYLDCYTEDDNTHHNTPLQTAFHRDLSALNQFILLLKFMINPHSNSKLKIHTPPIPSCQHCQRPVSFTVLSRAVVTQDGLLKSFTCQSCPPTLSYPISSFFHMAVVLQGELKSLHHGLVTYIHGHTNKVTLLWFCAGCLKGGQRIPISIRSSVENK